MHAYRIAGLNVSCELPLPGACPATTRAWDVVMRRDAVPHMLEGATASFGTWEVADEQYLIHAPGVARFLISQGRDVAFEPEPDASPVDCAAYLQGSVFAAVLHQRGQVVLHASAVAVSGRAVLICGRSGLGKSTLAAAISERGHPLLADDLCAIGFDETGLACVSGDARQCKLDDGTIASLCLEARRGAPVMRNRAKFYVEPGALAGSAAIPVAAVYALRREASERPAGLTALDRSNATRVLMRNAFRPQVVKRTGETARYFRAAAAMAERIPVSRLVRSEHLDRLSDLVDRIEDHWTQLGLLAGAMPGQPKTRNWR